MNEIEINENNIDNKLNIDNNVDNKLIKDQLIEVDNKLIKDQLIEDLSPICTYEHLKFCNCQKNKYKDFLKIRLDNLENDKKELKNTNAPAYTSIVMDLKRNALVDTGAYCENNQIRCNKYKNELTNTYNNFFVKYDINDPRVYELVKAIMIHNASVIKAQQYSNQNGTMIERIDFKGNSNMLLSPVEDLKIKLNDSIVKTIEILDRMIEGSKNVNLNVNTSTISMNELMKKINEKAI